MHTFSVEYRNPSGNHANGSRWNHHKEFSDVALAKEEKRIMEVRFPASEWRITSNIGTGDNT